MFRASQLATAYAEALGVEIGSDIIRIQRSTDMKLDVGSLNNDIAALENLFARTVSITHSATHLFNLSKVKFLGPHDIVGLVTCARLITQQQGHPVQLVDANANILQYLMRVNVFATANQWLLQPDDYSQIRKAQTHSNEHLLELTTIRQDTDIFEIVDRVRQICLPLKVANLGKITEILSEVCQNAFEHSGDTDSMVMVQRYLRPLQGKSEVQIAICDMGMGVRQSLVNTHGPFVPTTIDYLQAAFEGKSARSTGRGGLGLRSIEQIIAEDGGALWLRSENASILSHGPHKRRQNNQLALIPGTQVVVKLNGILLDLPPR